MVIYFKFEYKWFIIERKVILLYLIFNIYMEVIVESFVRFDMVRCYMFLI